GLLKDIQAYAREQGHIKEPEPDAPAAPADPGPPPNAYEEPHEFQAWHLKDRAYREHLSEQRIVALEQQMTARVQPLAAAHQQQEAAAQQRAMQTKLGLDDDDWGLVQEAAQKVQNDPTYAFQTLADAVLAGKRATAAKTKQVQDTAEAARGSEERTGLPATGPRARRKPTGNLAVDLGNELEADGVDLSAFKE
ncbi:unnamed protein product, partial [marine sediment metagenome]